MNNNRQLAISTEIIAGDLVRVRKWDRIGHDTGRSGTETGQRKHCRAELYISYCRDSARRIVVSGVGTNDNGHLRRSRYMAL